MLTATGREAHMGERMHGLGHFDIMPPLNYAEQQYLAAYTETRTSMPGDPYHVDDHPVLARHASFTGGEADVRSGYPGQPVSWAPDFSGESLHLHEGDGLWRPLQWLQYLYDNFLSPRAAALHVGDPRFSEFTFDHVLVGVVALTSNFTGALSAVSVQDGQVVSKPISQCVGCDYGEGSTWAAWK